MRKNILESIYILAIAAAIGMAALPFHPKAARWSVQRPSLTTAEDSLYAAELPALNITANAVEPARIISGAALRKLVQRQAVVLIDARPQAEYQAGHLPQALALPFAELPQHMDELVKLPQNTWLVTYCDGPPCDLSHLLAQVLMQNGFRHVAIYDAGVDDWKAGNGALHQGDRP
jgi:rhodanese-related sulfurtransferase